MMTKPCRQVEMQSGLKSILNYIAYSVREKIKLIKISSFYKINDFCKFCIFLKNIVALDISIGDFFKSHIFTFCDNGLISIFFQKPCPPECEDGVPSEGHLHT
jgi:hypothetical protein